MWQFTVQKNKFVLKHKRQGIFASCCPARIHRFFRYSSYASHGETFRAARLWLVNQAREKKVLQNGYCLPEYKPFLYVKVNNCRGDCFIAALEVEDLCLFRGDVWKLSMCGKRLYRWHPALKKCRRFLHPLFTLRDPENENALEKWWYFVGSRSLTIASAFRKWKKLRLLYERLKRQRYYFDRWFVIKSGYYML
jgi:hypothetical protein|tara:strand:+ start:6046 stop:6627 length:582 start_codon:yes stop_codon:yes gene_type:complete